jgi:BMFP domain-containing protein YqiC
MSTVQRWVVLNDDDDDSVACQTAPTDGRKPSEAGDNPTGLREFKVSRHGDLTHERYSVAARRWVSDGDKKRRAVRRAELRGLDRDELADRILGEVRAEVRRELDELAARITNLESKGKA